MTARPLILLAGLGSAALLLGAFGFQYIGGLAPCAMCLWQRWPHVVAMALAAVGAAVPNVLVALLGALSMLVNAGIAIYHTGVERDWWQGPQTCSGGSDLGLGGGDLLDFDTVTQVVRCDEVAWQMLGLSMASWNGLACLALAYIWFFAVQKLADPA